MNQQDRDSLNQKLMELHFGLLDAAEADALLNRIGDEKEVAEQWEVTQKFLSKLGKATGLPHADTTKPDYLALLQGVTGTEDSSDVSSLAVPSPVRSTSELNRRPVLWANCCAMIAAMLGCLIVGRGYLLRLPTAPLAKTGVKISALSGSGKQAERGYQVSTFLINQSILDDRIPVIPASVSFQILSASGSLFEGSIASNELGMAKIILPKRLVIPPNATLRVVAKASLDNVEESTVTVSIPRTRTVTHLRTDRPVYRRGEEVFFRSLTLNRKSLEPVSGFPVEFTLHHLPESGTSGILPIEPIRKLVGVTQSGVSQGSFRLPRDAEFGDYDLVVRSLDGMFPEEKIALQVRDYQIPKLGQTISWSQSSFRPGERVEANLSLRSLLPQSLPLPSDVSATLVISGEAQGNRRFEVDSNGEAKLSFDPPPSETRDLQLRVTAVSGSNSESRLFDVPIQSGHLQMELFPEGGDLSAGLVNGVYFAVTDRSGKPVDGHGELVTESGEVVRKVKTLDSGRGKFDFIPELGQRYRVILRASSESTSHSFTLPEIREDLPVLDAQGGVVPSGESVRFKVISPTNDDLIVRIACRGKLVVEQSLQVMEGDNLVEIPMNNSVGGVLRLTILKSRNGRITPVAERLLYRRPYRKLNIESVGNQPLTESMNPGERIQMRLRVTNELNEPTEAILGISVVDQASLSLNQNEQVSLNTKFLLLSEVKEPSDLENADFYLGPSREAEQRLDLLLGTQGWRRFVTWDETSPSEEFKALIVKLLDLNGMDSMDREITDNQDNSVSDWYLYRQALQNSLERAWIEIRYVAVIAMGVWGVVFLSRRKRNHKISKWNSAAIVFIAFTLVGCGASLDSSEEMAVSNEFNRIEDSQSLSENMGESESDSVDGPVELSVMAEAGNQRMVPAMMQDSMMMGLGDGPDEKWTDWLTERKVAWLMRQLDPIRELDDDPDQGSTDANQKIAESDLEALLDVRGMSAEAAADELIRKLGFPLRQYAHTYQGSSVDGSSDYQETIFWHPMITTDSQGRCVFEFELPDSQTYFDVRVDAHSLDGRLGSFREQVRVSELSQK